MRQSNIVIVLLFIALVIPIGWLVIHYVARHLVRSRYEWLQVLDDKKFKFRDDAVREMLRIKDFRYAFFLTDIFYSDLESLVHEGLVMEREFLREGDDLRHKGHMLTELGRSKRGNLYPTPAKKNSSPRNSFV